MADHLMDVVSTDQEMFKPEFDGKLDFAAFVQDSAANIQLLAVHSTRHAPLSD
jgi:hypothetical protein